MAAQSIESGFSSTPIYFEFIHQRLPTGDATCLKLAKSIFPIKELQHFSDKNEVFFLDRQIRWVGNSSASQKQWVFYSSNPKSNVQQFDLQLYQSDAEDTLIPELQVSLNNNKRLTIKQLLNIEQFFKQIAENNSLIGFEEVWRMIAAYHEKVFKDFQNCLKQNSSDQNRQEIEARLQTLIHPLQIDSMSKCSLKSLPYPGERGKVVRQTKYDSNCQGPLEIEEFILNGGDTPIIKFEVLYGVDASIAIILYLKKDEHIKSFFRSHGLMFDVLDYESRRVELPSQLQTFYQIMIENNDCCKEFINLKENLRTGLYVMTEEQQRKTKQRNNSWLDSW